MSDTSEEFELVEAYEEEESYRTVADIRSDARAANENNAAN